jgi:hypothetical protein
MLTGFVVTGGASALQAGVCTWAATGGRVRDVRVCDVPWEPGWVQEGRDLVVQPGVFLEHVRRPVSGKSRYPGITAVGEVTFVMVDPSGPNMRRCAHVFVIGPVLVPGA